MKKPKVINNWQSITYEVDGVQINKGDKVLVEWPDGTQETVKLVGKKETNYYSEQGVGIPQGVESTILFVKASINGLSTLIPVEKLKVEIL